MPKNGAKAGVSSLCTSAALTSMLAGSQGRLEMDSDKVQISNVDKERREQKPFKMDSAQLSLVPIYQYCMASPQIVSRMVRRYGILGT